MGVEIHLPEKNPTYQIRSSEIRYLGLLARIKEKLALASVMSTACSDTQQSVIFFINGVRNGRMASKHDCCPFSQNPIYRWTRSSRTRIFGRSLRDSLRIPWLAVRGRAGNRLQDTAITTRNDRQMPVTFGNKLMVDMLGEMLKYTTAEHIRTIIVTTIAVAGARNDSRGRNRDMWSTYGIGRASRRACDTMRTE